MAEDRYSVKIFAARGDATYRFNLTRRHVFLLGATLGCVLIAALALHFYQLRQAEVQLEALQHLTAHQRAQLETIDARTSAISSQLHAVQSQNKELQRMLGIRPDSNATIARWPLQKMVRRRPTEPEDAKLLKVVTRLSSLARASADTSDEAARIRRLTLRILNVRYLARIKRARMLASIPSINPAGGAAIAGCFCLRSYPTAEFHLGVDLDANYGDVVRASAAGTIITSDYDGEFGLKIDIDHHNGYHTWYAHLSRADVHPGQAVAKGQPIALVGSSGRSTGPHLHYQIMHNGQAVDPQPFLKGFPPQVLTSLP